MERKSFSTKALSDEGRGEAVIATLGVIDKDGDVTLPGFFGTQPVRVIPTHDWSHVMLGKGTLTEEAAEAVARFALNLDLASGREWHSALKFDLANEPPLQEWSYGFDILPGGSEQGERDGRTVRILKPRADGSPGCKVHEISPVLLGAGIGTRTREMKGQNGKYADDIETALEEVRAVVGRGRRILDMRAKDGRGLSAERRAQLGKLDQVVVELAATAAELKALATAGDVKQPDAASLLAEFDRTKARIRDAARLTP